MAGPPPAGGQASLPLKQKVTSGWKSLLGGAVRLATGADADHERTKMADLFAKTDAAVDGDACLHDCDSCVVEYPRNFKIDESDLLYGHIRGWSTHILVATGKSDWVRSVADEKGSVMQAVDKAHPPSNGVSRRGPACT